MSTRTEPGQPRDRSVRRIATWVALSAALAPSLAAGGPLDALNAVRTQGCDGKPGVKAKLAHDPALNEVAMRMSSGAALGDAVAAAHFHARLSTSISIAGTPDEKALTRVIASRFCADVLNADFERAGAWERGKDVWIVLATPFTLPQAKDVAAIRNRALELVNQARSKARKCGWQKLGAARPVGLSIKLDRAALT